MEIDRSLGAAELERLADRLKTPCQLGEYVLEGLICRTSTALIFVARGGAFGSQEGVLKLTGRVYSPLLEHELRLLNSCRRNDVSNVVRPIRSELEWLENDAAAMLLPFLDGGDLVQWIGAHTPGPFVALEVGQHVGTILRSLLQLPKPLVHRDVKPQNVLLAFPGAPLSQLTLIDFDVSEEVQIPHLAFATASAEIAEGLAGDVRGFGELLFDLATGRDPPTHGPPTLQTGNTAFDALVEKCLTSHAGGSGYVSMADTGLWRDLYAVVALEKARPSVNGTRRGRSRHVSGHGRRYLAVLGAFLLIGLVAAIASKVLLG